MNFVRLHEFRDAAQKKMRASVLMDARRFALNVEKRLLQCVRTCPNRTLDYCASRVIQI